jgi:hypothetical protein
LVQFAKEKQSAAQAATGAHRPTAELARPRIIPHPVAGTIEFERGQIVAKMGERARCRGRMITTGLPTGRSRDRLAKLLSFADIARDREVVVSTESYRKGGRVV